MGLTFGLCVFFFFAFSVSFMRVPKYVDEQVKLILSNEHRVIRECVVLFVVHSLFMTLSAERVALVDDP